MFVPDSTACLYVIFRTRRTGRIRTHLYIYISILHRKTITQLYRTKQNFMQFWFIYKNNSIKQGLYARNRLSRPSAFVILCFNTCSHCLVSLACFGQCLLKLKHNHADNYNNYISNKGNTQHNSQTKENIWNIY